MLDPPLIAITCADRHIHLLALVEITKDRAQWLVRQPVSMRHALVAVPGRRGRMIVRAVDVRAAYMQKHGSHT